MQNTVHFILQGKGGIGKTLVSTLLANGSAPKDARPLRCYDTDQENATFSRYKAMSVKHVPVMTDDRTIDPKRFDALMIDMLETDGNCVIDNGANSFSPLMAYLLENDCFGLLQESGRKVYIHTIVGGGDTLHDTATGFVSTAKATRCRWCCGRTNTSAGWPRRRQAVHRVAELYRQRRRVRGRVVLAAAQPDTFGADLKKMNMGRLTLDEVHRQRQVQRDGKAAHQGRVPPRRSSSTSTRCRTAWR
jgi:hypothetical protein